MINKIDPKNLVLDKKYVIEFDLSPLPIRLVGHFNRRQKKTATFHVWNEATKSYAIISVDYKQIIGEYDGKD